MRWVAASLLLAAACFAPRPAAAFSCDSNLLIVLDRSCSMNSVPQADGGTETRSKWQIAVQVITALLTSYQDRIRFGLILFPDRIDPNCEQAAIPAPVGPGNEAVITALFAPDAGLLPGGPCVTNIDTAMQQAKTDPGLAAVAPDAIERRSFVLLISDGMQSGQTTDGGVTGCGGVVRDPITIQAITDLYNAGVPTYVVGFGSAVRPTSLESFGTAGGVGPTTGPHYYLAEDAAQFEEILGRIAGAVAADPELGGCLGLPCPDGRCYLAHTSCSSEGVCVPDQPDGGTPLADAAVLADAPADQGTDGGGPPPGVGGKGCGCALGAGAGAVPLLFAAILALALLGRPRPRR
jgi:hypothetical protein